MLALSIPHQKNSDIDPCPSTSSPIKKNPSIHAEKKTINSIEVSKMPLLYPSIHTNEYSKHSLKKLSFFP